MVNISETVNYNLLKMDSIIDL